MEVLKAKVDWKETWANFPELVLLVDELPRNLTYEEKVINDFSSLWFGEKDGFVAFYAEDKTDKSGFGGRVFTLDREDSSPKLLKGPWSSRSGVMNREFDIQSLEVVITDDPKVWERGYTFYAGKVTLEFAKKAVELLPDVELIKVYRFDDEVYYIPNKLIVCPHKELGSNNRCKECGHKVYEPYKDGYREVRR